MNIEDLRGVAMDLKYSPEVASKLGYSAEEAADQLSVGRAYMYELIRRGEIESVKIGRRRIVPGAALQSYMERLVREQNEGAAA